MSVSGGSALPLFAECFELGDDLGRFWLRSNDAIAAKSQCCLQFHDVSLGQKRPKSSPSSKHSANNGKADPPETDT